ncbi:MAG: hypothetical protein F4Y24_11910 [Gemmatimonadetes bacterium]|nr:hypothetical protein [Gemmatimonadota bacterium]MYG21751.1 hypothetical protein [Gemmatimonadota bacterium]MYJ37459.1 hypothetical protein [Gemmatimonadota bacterium]
MAFRVYEYVNLILSEADVTEDTGPEGAPPIVIPIVIYNGYILADLKAPEFSNLPPGNWFAVLAEWESARWAEDAVRLVELWRKARGSGDSSIVRGFDALRQQTDSWLPIPAAEPGARLLPGGRKTMIRHEETWLAENRREGRRLLLRQLVLQKFGPEAVAELSRVLTGPSDSDRTRGIALAIIECATAAEFIARVREL